MQHRHRNDTAKGYHSGDAQRAIGGIFVDIRDMGNGAVQDCTANGAVLACWSWVRLPKGLNSFRCHTIVADEVNEFPVELKHGAKLRLAQPHGALGDHVEYRLDIVR
jgi:hypothetical protein